MDRDLKLGLQDAYKAYTIRESYDGNSKTYSS